MNQKVVMVIRHPKVEGEGAGEATAARDAHSSLSSEGQQQVDQIISTLQVIFPPSQVVCGKTPRYYRVGQAIAKAFDIPLVILDNVQQTGGRSDGEERVQKLRIHRQVLQGLISQADNRTVIITSNPLIEGSLHEGEITWETMEAHRQDFRTDPGNAVFFDNQGKPLARINIFW